MVSYVMGLDIGTSGTRAVLYDHACRVVSSAHTELNMYFPRDGWVEQDADEIYIKTLEMASRAIKQAGIYPSDIKAIGITNQRETTVFWDKTGGKPVCRAVVWQDRRTRYICERLKENDGDLLEERTGMILIPNCAATKIAWLLENNHEVQRGVQEGRLLYGTLDSYVIWRLTGGAAHVTDTSNNSVTLLQNALSLDYDDEVLRRLHIPKSILPEIVNSSQFIAETSPKEFFGEAVPVSGILGDQQASSIGQGCLSKGEAKNTYGTGSFIVMNTGENYVAPANGVFSPVLYSRRGDVCYGLEAMADVSGYVLQWLRDGLGMVSQIKEIETLADEVLDTGGVFFVPAFAGLGSPYFDAGARGTIIGLNFGTTKHHIARAALESIAFQVCDALAALENSSGVRIQHLRVDGGVAKSDLLLQTQADLLGIPVMLSDNAEATSRGAAIMAGLAVSYWNSIDEIPDLQNSRKAFIPSITDQERQERLALWREAVARAGNWFRG